MLSSGETAQLPQVALDKAPPGAGRHIPRLDLTGQVDVPGTGIDYVGHGGFANIFEGFYKEAQDASDMGMHNVDSREKPRKVAVKAYYLQDGEDRLGDAEKASFHAASIWNRLSHQHVAPFLGHCSIPSRSPVPCLVSPFYDNQDISHHLKTRGRDDHAYVLKLLVQLAAGLAYMHNLSPVIAHGDIKGANILIDNDGNVRITDFDLSRIVDLESTADGYSIGSLRWMAPELLLEPNNPVTTESDVWALGMTILEVLTGERPFADYKNMYRLAMALGNGERPQRPDCPSIADTVWVLLQGTWDLDPEERPPAHVVGLVLELLYTSFSHPAPHGVTCFPCIKLAGALLGATILP